MLRSAYRWLAAARGGRAARRDPRSCGAQEARFELGFRGLVLLGKGTPANDMIGEGLVGRWRLNDAWHLGIALDNVTFDYETPNRALGIAATTVVDGINEWQRASVFAERRFDSERRWDWHWLAGVGERIGRRTRQRRRAARRWRHVRHRDAADDEMHVFAGGGLHRALGAAGCSRRR